MWAIERKQANTQWRESEKASAKIWYRRQPGGGGILSGDGVTAAENGEGAGAMNVKLAKKRNQLNGNHPVSEKEESDGIWRKHQWLRRPSNAQWRKAQWRRKLYKQKSA